MNFSDRGDVAIQSKLPFSTLFSKLSFLAQVDYSNDTIWFIESVATTKKLGLIFVCENTLFFYFLFPTVTKWKNSYRYFRLEIVV